MSTNIYVITFVLACLAVLPIALGVLSFLYFRRRYHDAEVKTENTAGETPKVAAIDIPWDGFDKEKYLVFHLHGGKKVYFNTSVMIKGWGAKPSHLLRALMVHKLIAISADDFSAYPLSDDAGVMVQDILEAYMYTDIDRSVRTIPSGSYPDPMKFIRFQYADGSIRMYHAGIFFMWQESPSTILNAMIDAGMLTVDADNRCMAVSGDDAKAQALEILLEAYMDPYQALIHAEGDAAYG